MHSVLIFLSEVGIVCVYVVCVCVYVCVYVCVCVCVCVRVIISLYDWGYLRVR